MTGRCAPEALVALAQPGEPGFGVDDHRPELDHPELPAADVDPALP
jgi:hypothetical protein